MMISMAAIVNGNLPEVWSLLDAPGAAPAIFEGEEAMALSIACVHAGSHPNLEREGIVNALYQTWPNWPPAVGALGTGSARKGRAKSARNSSVGAGDCGAIEHTKSAEVLASVFTDR